MEKRPGMSEPGSGTGEVGAEGLPPVEPQGSDISNQALEQQHLQQRQLPAAAADEMEEEMDMDSLLDMKRKIQMLIDAKEKSQRSKMAVEVKTEAEVALPPQQTTSAVSYTHLTLPTIYSV